jgi:hypothetical protein
MAGASVRGVLPLAALAVTGALGLWAAACGLPLGGLGAPGTDPAADGALGAEGAALGGDDGGGDDGPASCANLDAACLGGLPSGWQPVSVADAGCPSAFTAETLQVNPRLGDGGCACGACQIVGSFSCTSGVAVSGGNGCNDPTLVTATPDTCAAGFSPTQHVEAHPVASGGTVGCSAPNDAGTGATTDPLTLCYPGCTADFCGAGSRCIVSEGDVPCPGGFTLFAKAGTSADPGCAPCACDAGATGPCGGTATVYDDTTCGDSGASATYAVGTCNTYSVGNGEYQSVLVHLVPPDASCTVAAATVEGDASLVGVRTICCL